MRGLFEGTGNAAVLVDPMNCEYKSALVHCLKGEKASKAS
jgi:hypothetical protein